VKSKARRIAAVIGIVCTVNGAAQGAGGGVPVIDVSNLEQAMLEVENLTKQLTALQAQLDTLKAQAQIITNLYNESRGITQHATMIPNSVQQLHGFFPTVENETANLLEGPLNAVANGLRSAKEMFSFETFSDDETAHLPSVELYKERGDVVYAYMSAAKDSYEKFAERRAMLETFVTAAGTANTEKAVLDLNTRISAETVLMLNDIAMLQSLTLMAQMEQASLDYNEAGLAMYRPVSAEAQTGAGAGDWNFQYHGAEPSNKTQGSKQ